MAALINWLMNVKTASTFALLLGLASVAPAFGLGKAVDWQPANEEAVRMDPANYQTGRTYRPGRQAATFTSTSRPSGR
jgi:hypothetical protein